MAWRLSSFSALSRLPGHALWGKEATVRNSSLLSFPSFWGSNTSDNGTASATQRSLFSTSSQTCLQAQGTNPTLSEAALATDLHPSQDSFWARGGGFDASLPVQQAWTPPSGWYRSDIVAAAEMDRVFLRGWQAVGHVGQVANPGDFFTGTLGNVRYIVCRDGAGQLQAFHNVCRHHGASVAHDSGTCDKFVCGYHGWTYGLDGRLQKATKLAGIQNFSAREFGLHPIPRVGSWGPFVLLSFEKQAGGGDERKAQEVDQDTIAREWLSDASSASHFSTMPPVVHVARREKIQEFNWKIFVENYLECYHCQYAHPTLASALDMTNYTYSLYDRVSIQHAPAAEGNNACIGGGAGANGVPISSGSATYAFIFPNFCVNRYGPWVRTNTVLPLSQEKCVLRRDFYLERAFTEQNPSTEQYVEDCMAAQAQVGLEDQKICEDLQRGLMSPAWNGGRYNPSMEKAQHHFHKLLHTALSG